MTWNSEDSSWKSGQIMQIIKSNGIQPKTITEIGCGAGQILEELSKQPYLKGCEFEGYDISPQAIELCKKINRKNCKFFCKDLLEEENINNQKKLTARDFKLYLVLKFNLNIHLKN